MLRQTITRSLIFIALLSVLSHAFAGFEHLIDTEALIAHLQSIGQGKEDGFQHEEPLLIEGPQPSVQTASGLVYGVPWERGQIFYGIPYAEPPIGDLRFRNPVPYAHDDRVHNKTYQDVLMCYQIASFLNRNEDCLIVDVFVPSHVDLSNANNPPTDRLPVMFSIHGGGFTLGSGTWRVFDGRYLSDVTNTIVVSINYRLGPFGYLLLEDEEGNKVFEGNQGFKDQQLALKWVHDNIERFGGDKNEVTIMGESAGGQSVNLHMVSSESEPYFKRAIMQSNNWPNNYKTRESAINDTATVVDFLRCGAIDTQITRDCCRITKSDYECLMSAGSQQLTNVMMRMMASNLVRELRLIDAVEPFRPYVDGVEIMKQPIELFKDGNWHKHKPLITGTNQEELIILKYIFGPFLRNEFLYRGLNQAIYARIGDDVGDMISDKYIQTYGPDIDDWAWLFSQQMTDIFFGCSMRALARYASYSTEAAVYWYQYHHYLDGPDCEQRFGFLCGHSSHAFDLHFVYRTINHSGLIQKEPDDTLVMNQFSTYFGAFARTGDPNAGLETSLQGSFPFWPPYENNVLQDSPGPWVNVRIAPTTQLESNHREDMCNFLDTLGVYMPPEQHPVSTSTPPQTTESTTTTTTLSTTSGVTTRYLFNYSIFGYIAVLVSIIREVM